MAKINQHLDLTVGIRGKIDQFMQINFIRKAKQFVGDSKKRKLQKKPQNNQKRREKCLHRLLTDCCLPFESLPHTLGH